MIVHITIRKYNDIVNIVFHIGYVPKKNMGIHGDELDIVFVMN